MTNLAENQKDEQIARQKETIDSLERKVQSLESELQKCLDPDSGEINPAIRYHYRSGEDALRQQIEDLQRQLDDCLEPSHGELIQDKERRLEERIGNAITAAFLPTRDYNHEQREWYFNHLAWWAFREFLFDCNDLFADQWSRPEFRDAVAVLNDMCQATEDRPTKIKQFSRFELANRLFAGSDKHNQTKYRAVQTLITSLSVMMANHEHEEIKPFVSKEELRDMMGALRIISACQKLWMEAQPEKEEPDAEE